MSEAQRIGPGNCLTKTQGCANSKDDVYSLTPARCRKVKNPHFEELTDATWDERFAVCCLIFCVAGLGSFPIWASHVIDNAVVPILSVIPTL